MKRYILKNRLIVGNQKHCDIYVKYMRPIYVYHSGIYNPTKQEVYINGKQYCCNTQFKTGDYIQVKSLNMRITENEVHLSGEYKTGLKQLHVLNVQYNAYIPVINDIVFNPKHFHIKNFDVEKQKIKMIQYLYPMITTLLMSLLFYIFFKNMLYIIIMSSMSMMVGFVQFIIHLHAMQQQKKVYHQKVTQYHHYLQKIFLEIYESMQAFRQYDQQFLSPKVFSYKKSQNHFLNVVLGKVYQNQITFEYRKKDEWVNTNFDKQILQVIEYYKKQTMNFLFSLKNKKVMVQNNTYVLDEIIAQLILSHSYIDLRIKLVGNFKYVGKHFENIEFSQVIQDDSLYIFDKFYPEIEYLNIQCIVLSEEIHCVYDEIIYQQEECVTLLKSNQKIIVEKTNKLLENQFLLQQYTLYEKKENDECYLFDVYHTLHQHHYNYKKNIVAHINQTTMIDFHEQQDGSHALIVGMTGSGKSELLQAIVTALCIEYSPKQVQFVVIDYKGSAFASKIENFPHVIGVMDNLNENLLRCIAVLKQELLYRQKLFRKNSITHIDESNLSHLFIVCDEFAELKKEQPQFIDDLVSISRIGRSLGIHLILATQKPSGVISEEILNNASIKIALKLQDVTESQYLLGTKDALTLSNAGDAIIKTPLQYTKCRSMYVNAIACIKNPHRMIVDDKIINDHQYFHFTEREYFQHQYLKSMINIFQELPLTQSECFLLQDELPMHVKCQLEECNTLVYGDSKTGKTTTLHSIISQISKGVVYYVYEDVEVNYNKAIIINRFHHKHMTRLCYQLQRKHDQVVSVVIDNFQPLKQMDYYDEIVTAIQNSEKNNVVFYISSKEELPYLLQPYFKNQFVLYYPTQQRTEISKCKTLFNQNIAGRIWKNQYEAQIGINIAPIDYLVDKKYSLDNVEYAVLQQDEIGYQDKSLKPFQLVTDEDICVICKSKTQFEYYKNRVNHARLVFVSAKQEYIAYHKMEHIVFLDEYSLTMYGDHYTTLNKNECLYVGLRKKEKLFY